MKKFQLFLLCLFCSLFLQKISAQEECIIEVQLNGTLECPDQVSLDLLIFNTTEYTNVDIQLYRIENELANPVPLQVELIPIEPFISYVFPLGTYTAGTYEVLFLLLDELENPVCTGLDLESFQCDCPDSDGDTVCDVDDTCPGFNDLADADNDTIPDGCDECFGVNSSGDADGDGICASNDTCDSDPNKTSPGICGCGVTDVDSDNDGTPDCNDSCPNDANKIAPGVCGCGVIDADSDNDGSPDCNDICPNDANKTSPGICGCGIPDIDSDGDGVADCNDNCPNTPNADQADSNGNSVGDACEACSDSDADGVCDQDDICQGFDDLADADGDTIPDGCDNCPNLANPNQEPDGDCDGVFPADDCDDNDPNIGSNANDADCDGVPTSEDCNDNDPNITTSTSTDSDNDGTPDCEDLCPNDRLKIDPGDCGCGNKETDRDVDGVADCIDLELRSACPNAVNADGVSLDSDNDGVPDCEDICPGFDDNIDFDGDKIPDSCDSSIYCRGDKIAICHENNGRFTTICVSPQQLERHRNHPNDDLNGPCSGVTAASVVYEDNLSSETKLDMSVYPNPGKGQVNIEMSNVQEPSVLQIYNILGIQVYEEAVSPSDSQTKQLNENLSPGTYIVKLSNRLESISTKLIIEN